jgi:hypothetical protein
LETCHNYDDKDIIQNPHLTVVSLP